MIRRLNFTGRKKIPRSRVRIVVHGDDLRRTFDAELTTLESEPGTLGEGGVLKLLRQIAGFKLIGTLGPEVPRRLRVRVAYEVLRGNPFKRHDPLDFRLDQKPIALHHDGVTLVRVEANELELAVTADTFELKAIGFDANRDLRIKVEPLEGPA